MMTYMVDDRLATYNKVRKLLLANRQDLEYIDTIPNRTLNKSNQYIPEIKNE